MMRTIVIICFCTLFTTAILVAQWEVVNEGGYFTTIDFVSENVGWVGGYETLLNLYRF